MQLDRPYSTTSPHASDLAIRVRQLSKSFPGVRALRSVNFDVRSGEIHGLVGANGAGKSTLIRVLAGATVPDEGNIEVQGKPITISNPRQVRAAGIAAIYQELTIVPEMSAMSNVFLGAVPSRGFFTDRRQMERRFTELAGRMGLSIGAHEKAGGLPVAGQQMIEILRAVHADHSVIIMDEPTAALGPFERSKLFDLIGRLRATGTSIIFISHDLDEVLALCDRVSVMRDGELILTDAATNLSKDRLVAAMLGTLRAAPIRDGRVPRGPEVLAVRDLGVEGRVAGVSFVLHEGELLGIAGLVGSGRSEVLRALAGADPAATGTLAIDGRARPLPHNVREGIAMGLALAPEDRKHQGLVLGRSALSNLTLTDLHAVARGPVIDEGQRNRRARRLANDVGFDANRLGALAGTLSGGNQQKLVIARSLLQKPRLIIFDEPTKGVDVGAIAEIHQLVGRLADAGMSIIVISSYLPEVLGISDRVLVYRQGRVVEEFSPKEATTEKIMYAAVH
jgi:rhamnose transport system ATP-binding protein